MLSDDADTSFTVITAGIRDASDGDDTDDDDGDETEESDGDDEDGYDGLPPEGVYSVYFGENGDDDDGGEDEELQRIDIDPTYSGEFDSEDVEVGDEEITTGSGAYGHADAVGAAAGTNDTWYISRDGSGPGGRASGFIDRGAGTNDGNIGTAPAGAPGRGPGFTPGGTGGYAAGRPVNLSGYVGPTVAPLVTPGGELAYATADGITSLGVPADKGRVASSDWDFDGERELVFVRGGELYLYDVAYEDLAAGDRGAGSVEPATDSDGNPITVDATFGVQ